MATTIVTLEGSDLTSLRGGGDGSTNKINKVDVKTVGDWTGLTLGSRGFFFLIDTEAALRQKKSGGGYFFLLGALRLVNAASPRTISADKKNISSGIQGI